MKETSCMNERDARDSTGNHSVMKMKAKNVRMNMSLSLSSPNNTPELPLSCLPTVPVKIIFFKDAVKHHNWCFPFSVDGNPEPTISWLYNGQEPKKSKFMYIKFMPDSGDGSVKHGCLNLNKPTHINNGNYTLIVQNKLGRDEATAFGLFMENPFGTFDPEGKIVGELLPLDIFMWLFLLVKWTSRFVTNHRCL